MLGPLIVGLAVSLFAVVSNIFVHTSSVPTADVFVMSYYFVVFAYFVGSKFAWLSGILVSIWMIWRPPNAIVAIAASTNRGEGKS